MRIMVNGDERNVTHGLSVEGLLAELGLAGKKVAVEHNLAIVPRSTYAELQVAEGDRLEIVHFIGGG
ncbi:MAG: sulfur carrier protein ThiS [Alphaproteobacteria bacterium]|nr:sulfur carrier protein ThiS [Alphaproteobacteria bacterium]